MHDQPLRPFAPPAFVSLSSVHAGAALGWFLLVVFSLWALFTLVAVYHWIRYAHAPGAALLAVATHLIVSLALVSYVLTGITP